MFQREDRQIFEIQFLPLFVFILIMMIFGSACSNSFEKRIIPESKIQKIEVISDLKINQVSQLFKEGVLKGKRISQKSLFVLKYCYPIARARLAYSDISEEKYNINTISLANINSLSTFNWLFTAKIDFKNSFLKLNTWAIFLIMTVLFIILIFCILLSVIYRIRQIKIDRELDAKEKMLSRTIEEYQMTLEEAKKMNSELIAAKEKAEEADKLKTAFLTNMSHEIRTPMNAIIGLSSFLIEPGLTLKETQEYVEIINSSSRHLLTIIDDIVDISRIEAGQIQIVLTPVNINKLLKEIFTIYEKTVELKKLRLVCSLEKPDKIIQVNTDETRLKQVLCNFLNNAIKFTDKGDIEFGYTLKEKFIEFFVRDTGIGIAPENLDVIFDRFRQVITSHTRNYEGNGLGLSISRGLIQKMGGNIHVKSELGKGSVFYFTIPYFQHAEIVNDSDISDKVNYSFNWGNNTILVVEDDKNNYSYIVTILLPTNVKILHAWNGKEAIELLKDHPEISLVLMDFSLPLMDGYEAAKAIKSYRSNVSIIGQSAYAFDDDIKKALNSGCDDYLTKPFQKEILIEKISKYMEKQGF